jgi:hypothetical protein
MEKYLSASAQHYSGENVFTRITRKRVELNEGYQRKINTNSVLILLCSGSLELSRVTQNDKR